VRWLRSSCRVRASSLRSWRDRFIAFSLLHR
jgi:hypothetical protein